MMKKGLVHKRLEEFRNWKKLEIIVPIPPNVQSMPKDFKELLQTCFKHLFLILKKTNANCIEEINSVTKRNDSSKQSTSV